jgi:hypothetical protein
MHCEIECPRGEFLRKAFLLYYRHGTGYSELHVTMKSLQDQ